MEIRSPAFVIRHGEVSRVQQAHPTRSQSEDVETLFRLLQSKQLDVARSVAAGTAVIKELDLDSERREQNAVAHNPRNHQRRHDHHLAPRPQAVREQEDKDRVRHRVQQITRHQEYEARIVQAELQILNKEVNNVQQRLAAERAAANSTDQVQSVNGAFLAGSSGSPIGSYAGLGTNDVHPAMIRRLEGYLEDLQRQKESVRCRFTELTDRLLREMEQLQQTERLKALRSASSSSSPNERTALNAAAKIHHEEEFEHKGNYQKPSVFISAPASAATPAMLVLADSNASALGDGDKDGSDTLASTSQIPRAHDTSPPAQSKSLPKSSESGASSSWASLKPLLPNPRLGLELDRSSSRRLSLQELRQRTSQLALTVQAAVARRMSLQSQIASTRFRATHERACSSSSGEVNNHSSSASGEPSHFGKTAHADETEKDKSNTQYLGKKDPSDVGKNREHDFFRRSLADLEKLERTFTTEFIASEHAQKELQAHGQRLAEVKQELQQSQVIQKRRHSVAAEMLQQAVGSHEQSFASRQEEVRKQVAAACQTQHDILTSASENATAAAAQAAQAAKASAQAAAEVVREAERGQLSNDGVPRLVDALPGQNKVASTSSGHSPLCQTRHSTIHAANAQLFEEVYRKCQLQERQIQQFRQQAEAVQMHSNEQTKLYQTALIEQRRLMEAYMTEQKRQAAEDLQQAESLAEVRCMELESRHASELAEAQKNNADLQAQVTELQGRVIELRTTHQQELRTKDAASAWHTASQNAHRLAELEASYKKQLADARKRAHDLATEEYQRQLEEFRKDMESARKREVVRRLARNADLVGKLKSAQQRLTNRQRIVEELVATEHRYLSNIELALKHFATPLRKLVEPTNNLPDEAYFHQEDYILTFANLEDIVALNTRFLSFLERGLSTTVSSISNSSGTSDRSLVNTDLPDIGKNDAWPASSVVSALLRAFQQFADEFELYADFIIAHEGLAPRLARLRSIPAFVEIEEAAMKQPEIRGFQLESLLINPVQRLPRYCMLLKEFLKNVPQHHPDRSALQNVCVLMKDVVGRCDRAANDAKLWQIEEHAIYGGNADVAWGRKRAGTAVSFSPMNSPHSLSRGGFGKAPDALTPSPRGKRYSIVRTGRKFVLDGELLFGNLRRPAHVYLFDDKMLVGTSGSRSMRWLAQILLESAQVSKLGDCPGFTVEVASETSTKRYKFFAETQMQADKWAADIANCINGCTRA